MTSVKTIVVRQSAFDHADPWEIVDAVSAFSGDLVRQGWLPDELPQETLWNSQVTNAFTQINRNGPSLYFYNVLASFDGTSQWDRLVSTTRSGLNVLGNVSQVQAYENIMAAYLANREAIVSGKRSDTYFKLPNDHDLYISFMPSSDAEDEFMERRAAWVRQLPMLEVVADDKYETRMGQIGEANPKRTERQAELAVAADEETKTMDTFYKQQAILKARMRNEAGLSNNKRSRLDKLLGR